MGAYIISKKIGYVGVTPLIIDSGLRTNLLYGNDNSSITDNELIETLKTFKLFENHDYDLDFVISNEHYLPVKCKRFHLCGLF